MSFSRAAYAGCARSHAKTSVSETLARPVPLSIFGCGCMR